MRAYSEQLGRWVEYDVIDVTSPQATHTITLGDGWVQKIHPLSMMRSFMGGESGRSAAQIKQANSRNLRRDLARPNVKPLHCACGEKLDSYDIARRYKTCRICRGVVQRRYA